MPSRNLARQTANALGRESSAFRAGPPSPRRRSSLGIELLIALRRDSKSFVPGIAPGLLRRPAHANAEPRAVSRWVALAVICAGELLAASQSLGIITALPAIAGDLEATLADLIWTILAYVLGNTIGLLLGGSMAEGLGGRRAFRGGLVLFVVGTVLAVDARGLSALLVARLLQGVGGGAVLAAGLSLLTDTLPDGPDRSKALGLRSFILGTCLLGGVLLGALVTEVADWRWTLGWPAVAAVALLAVTGRVLSPGRRRGFFAPQVVVLSTAAVAITAGLSVALVQLGADSKSSFALYLTGAAIALGVLIAGAILTRRDRHVIGDAAPLGPYLLAFMGHAPVLALFFLAVRALEWDSGFSSIVTATALFPLGIVALIGAAAGSAIMTRLGRVGAVVGFVTTAIGAAWLSLLNVNGGTIVLSILPPLSLAVVGFGISISIANAFAVSGATGAQRAQAPAALAIGQALFCVIGLALASAIAEAHTRELLASGDALASASAGGTQRGFLACAIIAALGAVLSVPLLGVRRRHEAEDRAAVPEPELA